MSGTGAGATVRGRLLTLVLAALTALGVVLIPAASASAAPRAAAENRVRVHPADSILIVGLHGSVSAGGRRVRDPSQLNLAVVGCVPLNYTDPTGHYACGNEDVQRGCTEPNARREQRRNAEIQEVRYAQGLAQQALVEQLAKRFTRAFNDFHAVYGGKVSCQWDSTSGYYGSPTCDLGQAYKAWACGLQTSGHPVSGIAWKIWNDCQLTWDPPLRDAPVANGLIGGLVGGFGAKLIVSGGRAIAGSVASAFGDASSGAGLGAAAARVLAGDSSGSLLAQLSDDTGAINLGKFVARRTLRNLGVSDEQFAAANSAIGRATASTDISVDMQDGNVIVRLSRPGADGFQVIQSVIGPDGAKSVVQLAYDSAGNLVHYDPKTP